MLINEYVTHMGWGYKSCYINATVMLIFVVKYKMFTTTKYLYACLTFGD